MKSTTIISALALSIPTLATPHNHLVTRQQQQVPFGGLTIRSASPIQYASVNAANTSFYLNNPTSTYCPPSIGSACPSQNDTLFIGGNSTLALHVEVPGGQQVYVDSTGALRYTAPHSANTGANSSTVGFELADNGLYLTYEGDDFLACPLSGAIYQVYAAGAVAGAGNNTGGYTTPVRVANVNGTSCLGFEFRVEGLSNATAAWEYA